MVIQCEACNTKFRIDDAKVTDKGVKVRCSKCKHVFTVRNDAPKEPSPFEYSLDAAGEASSPPQMPADASPPDPSPDESAGFEGFEFSPSGDNSSGMDIHNVSSPPSEQAEEYDSSTLPPQTDDPGSFDFGDVPFPAPDTQYAAAPETSDTFEFEQDFGLQPKEAPDAEDKPFPNGSLSVQNQAEAAMSFDFDIDSLSAPAAAEGDGVPAADDFPLPPNDVSVSDNLITNTFSDSEKEGLFEETAVSAAPPDVELPPAPDVPEFPAAAGQDPEPSPVVLPEQELPPLSIPSRKKESPVARIIVMVVVLAGLAAAVFFGSQMLSDKERAPEQKMPAEKFTLRSIKASYIKGSGDTELFVIRGEALNEFKKPRASVQVKGIIFGANGQPVSEKLAYCGNQLSDEQLRTMNMDKIGAALSNQFGDSLGNLDVAPGKSIPFIIVLPNPPADAREFGVEIAGSTSSAAK